MQEETLYFKDNVRKIDFILTYTINEKAQNQKHGDGFDSIKKREAFLKKFDEHGLEYEIQDCSVSYMLRHLVQNCKCYHLTPNFHSREFVIL